MGQLTGLLRGGAALLASSLVAAALLPGCATYHPKASADFPVAAPPETVLQPGDDVQVLYTYWKDLDLAQKIRSDGKISLKMVGEVQAAGKTPAGLRDELLGLYADKIKNPDISVVVAGQGSQRVYVGGEVLQPGLIPINGRLTLLEAVMQAGGPAKRSAKLRNVVLVREANGKRYARTFDLSKSFKDSESESIELQPYDVVFVSQKTIDKLDQYVDQYINGLVPRNFQATYVWSAQVSTDLQKTKSTNVNLGPFTNPATGN